MTDVHFLRFKNPCVMKSINVSNIPTSVININPIPINVTTILHVPSKSFDSNSVAMSNISITKAKLVRK